MDARNSQKHGSAFQNGSPKNGPSFMLDNNRIMHSRIIQESQNFPELHGGIVAIYRDEVLSNKTRTIRLLGMKSPAKINQTLLGYEVQARHKRILCPDLVTARYLKLFSELGCRSIRLPYDPTLTARLIPVLESAYQSIQVTVSDLFPDDPKCRQYTIQRICAIIRNELRKAR